MKRSYIAIFSVSVTAGTAYVIYDQVKALYIKRLISIWALAASKQNRELDEQGLKKALDVLYAWDVRLILVYTQEMQAKDKPEVLDALQAKMKKRLIMEQLKVPGLESLISKYVKGKIDNTKNTD